MADGRPVVEVDGLAVRFPGEVRDAVRDVALGIAQGERIGVLGPSGCGKSTFALALVGAIPALIPAVVSGRVAWADAPAPGTVAAGSGRAAFVQQDVESQLVALTAQGEIAFALENRGLSPGEIDRQVAQALREGPAGGIPASAETLRLSTGYRQRLALAAALAEQAGLTVLDEPTAHLDEAAAREAMTALAGTAAGALLLVEHRADLVAPLADRLLVFDRTGSPLILAKPDDALEAIAARPDLGLRLPAATRAALALRRHGAAPTGGLRPHAVDLLAAIGSGGRAEGLRRLLLAELAPPGRIGVPPGPALLSLDLATLRRGDATVLRDLSLAIGEGEIVGVAGANGAGKTSLGLLVAGALAPTRGRRVARGSAPARMVPQNPSLVFASPSLVQEAARRGVSWSEARRALEAFGMAPGPDRHPLRHSRGELRRIALALALACKGPAIVVLDEPTAGLDAHGLRALEARLEASRVAGSGILVVSHDVDWLARVSDRIVVLKDGRVAACDDPIAICSGAVSGTMPLAPPPGAMLAAALGWGTPA